MQSDESPKKPTRFERKYHSGDIGDECLATLGTRHRGLSASPTYDTFDPGSTADYRESRNGHAVGGSALVFGCSVVGFARRACPSSKWQVASVVGISEEAALVRRARAGDERAFVELITAHRSTVWAVCLRITGNPHDAEDAAQDALAAAWRNIERFRADARFSTWLFRIASNAALAVVRRRHDTVEINAEDCVGGDLGDRVTDADRVQRALMTLPEDFRVALVLRIYGDFSYDEIAVHQGILVQTVKSRLWRARSMLQDLLATNSDIT
jgi:RNA polymerase sigma factor (sigma-70 family)